MPATLKSGDKALIAVLALALVAAAAWWTLAGNVTGGAKQDGVGPVVVTQTKDGQRRVDQLDADVEFTIETPGTGVGADAETGKNTIRIQNGTVEVSYSNCSNQVCADHEPIAQPREQIVCLPHGLVIEVVEREEDASKLQ